MIKWGPAALHKTEIHLTTVHNPFFRESIIGFKAYNIFKSSIPWFDNSPMWGTIF